MNIEEFSKLVGVSTATVSRSLNGKGRISPSTRQMVLDKADELGFKLSLNAQRLATGVSRMIAVSHATEDLFDNPFHTRILQAIQHSLRGHGFGTVIDVSYALDEKHSLLKTWIESRGVDGVVLIRGIGPLEPYLRSLDRSDIPFVVIGDQPTEQMRNVSSITWSYERGAREASELLAAMGHKFVGFIGHSMEHSLRFLDPLRSHLKDFGVEIPDNLVAMVGMETTDVAVGLAKILSTSPRPTAIVCRNYRLTINLMQTLNNLGIRVPEDISVLGQDEVSSVEDLDPGLTVVRIDTDSLGRLAVDKLFDLRNRGGEPSANSVVDTWLITRKSLALSSDYMKTSE